MPCRVVHGKGIPPDPFSARRATTCAVEAAIYRWTVHYRGRGLSGEPVGLEMTWSSLLGCCSERFLNSLAHQRGQVPKLLNRQTKHASAFVGLSDRFEQFEDLPPLR